MPIRKQIMLTPKQMSVTPSKGVPLTLYQICVRSSQHRCRKLRNETNPLLDILSHTHHNDLYMYVYITHLDNLGRNVSLTAPETQPILRQMQNNRTQVTSALPRQPPPLFPSFHISNNSQVCRSSEGLLTPRHRTDTNQVPVLKGA